MSRFSHCSGRKRCGGVRLLAFFILFAVGFGSSCSESPSIELIDYGMSMSAVIDVMGKRGENRTMDTSHGGMLAKESWDYPEGKVIFYGNDVIEVWRYNNSGKLERIVPEATSFDPNEGAYREFRYHESAE